MAVESRWFIFDHQHKNFVIAISANINVQKTSVYTLVNGDVQWFMAAKEWITTKGDIIQQHIDSDVVVSDITFLWFLLFSMCHSLHVAVNKCINQFSSPDALGALPNIPTTQNERLQGTIETT